MDIKGELTTDEELVILGSVCGRRVQAPVITIGPAAKVRAGIRTNSIRIQGVVIGDIHADVAVIVEASATVRGVIRSPLITIREGATLSGGANMDTRKHSRMREGSPAVARPMAQRA